MLSSLKEFYAKEGHSSVPHRLGSLGNWVVKQRRNYEMGKLSPEKDLVASVSSCLYLP